MNVLLLIQRDDVIDDYLHPPTTQSRNGTHMYHKYGWERWFCRAAEYREKTNNENFYKIN